jgi:hypothetical protein
MITNTQMANIFSIDFYTRTPAAEREMCFPWESYGAPGFLSKDNVEIDGCYCYCRHYARLLYDDLMEDKLSWKVDLENNIHVHRENAFEKHVLNEYEELRLTTTHKQREAIIAKFGMKDVSDMSYVFARKNLTATEGYEALITLMNCNCCTRHNTDKPDMTELFSYRIDGHRFIYPKDKAMNHIRRVFWGKPELTELLE